MDSTRSKLTEEEKFVKNEEKLNFIQAIQEFCDQDKVEVLDSNPLDDVDVTKQRGDEIETASDLLLDAEYVGAVTATCEQQTNSLAADEEFSVSNFISCLFKYAEKDSEDYGDNIQMLLRLSDPLSTCSFDFTSTCGLSGTLDITSVPPPPKPVKTPTSSQRAVAKTAIQPTVKKNTKDIDEISILAKRFYYKLLDAYVKGGRKSIPFYEAAYHPQSLGFTVENMYFLSCLLSDNAIRLYTEDDILMVIPEAPENGDGSADNVSTFAQPMNAKIYEKLGEIFPADKPLVEFNRNPYEDI